MENKKLCIYHSADLDGKMSAQIVKKANPDIDLIGWNHGDEKVDFSGYKTIYIVDLDWIDCVGYDITSTKIINIDHHKTNSYFIDKGKAPIKYFVKTNKSACELCWEYLYPNKKIPVSVHMIGICDTYRQEETNKICDKIINWEDANNWCCYVYSCDDDMQNALLRDTIKTDSLFKDKSYLDWITYGFIINRNKKQTFQKRVNKGKLLDNWSKTIKIIFINSDTDTSMLGNYNCEIEIADVACVYYYDGSKDKWKVSLRTLRDDIDLSNFAQKYKGGGHRKAAGFSIDDFSIIFPSVMYLESDKK